MSPANLSPLARFQPYIDELKGLTLQRAPNLDKVAVAAALDGQPSRKLQGLVRARFLHRTGTFFSGKALAARLIESGDLSAFGVIDPACGAGDLLIAFARKLRLKGDFESTVDDWGMRIFGCDLHPEFIETTKVRLCLLVHERGLQPARRIQPERLFPNIVVGNGLTHLPRGNVRAVLMNPPYTWVKARSGCNWGSGRVCSAALFVDRWLSLLTPGSKLKAILPDVLRTGANYEAWRQQIGQAAKIDRVSVVGKFSESVDVDVFLLELTVGASRHVRAKDAWQWYSSTKPHAVVGDFFSVQVGRIVPHRDPKKGPERAYLDSKAAP